jgi:phosphoadenosine phosphosulfate reductase
MWNLIERYGVPRRDFRYCCQQLKEYCGRNWYSVTGIRWAESPRRKATRALFEVGKNGTDKITLNSDNVSERKLTEYCMAKGKHILNPIIDWSDDEVWAYLKSREVLLNPLYAEGFKRVGCIGCPNHSKHRVEDFERWPKYKSAYIRAIGRNLEYVKKTKPDVYEKWDMKDAEEYFNWWLSK